MEKGFEHQVDLRRNGPREEYCLHYGFLKYSFSLEYPFASGYKSLEDLPRGSLKLTTAHARIEPMPCTSTFRYRIVNIKNKKIQTFITREKLIVKRENKEDT